MRCFELSSRRTTTSRSHARGPTADSAMGREAVASWPIARGYGYLLAQLQYDGE